MNQDFEPAATAPFSTKSAHLRRWARIDRERAEKDRAAAGRSGSPPVGHFVEWNGKAVASVKKGFAKAVELAGLDGRVSPHTLRHTAATWLMQAGIPTWEAAGFLGMSVQMLDRVYGHHSTSHLKNAANRIGYRPRQKGEPLAGKLAGPVTRNGRKS